MGSWGITERESDYGLDLLSTIVDTQLKAVNFSTFNVADAIDTITADIMQEIRKAKTLLTDPRYKSVSIEAKVLHTASQTITILPVIVPTVIASADKVHEDDTVEIGLTVEGGKPDSIRWALTRDGKEVPVTLSANSGTLTFDGAGDYSLTAIAKDAQGREFSSEPVMIKVIPNLTLSLTADTDKLHEELCLSPMGREITAASRLAESHLRKKILSGALTGQNYFAVLTWLGFRGTPSAGHLVPPSLPQQEPFSKIAQRPGAPRHGFSRAGPPAWAQRNTVRRPAPGCSVSLCVTTYSQLLAMFIFILTFSEGSAEGSAAKLGLSKTEVSVRISRGRQLLGDIVTREGFLMDA